MSEDLKEQVKKHYGEIAGKVQTGGSSCCCGTSCCSSVVNPSLFYESDYLKGLPKEAVAASLGCANPLVLADLKEGETVLDLGSGGGIDVLAASKYVGPGGKVYGLDMTDEMLALANQNKERMGVANVEFLKGYIEDIPLPDASVDVVLSNCVINLSEDKERVFREIYRVLKPGGRVAIADIVSLKEVPEAIRRMAEMWVGCIAGALDINVYRQLLSKAGFRDVEVRPEHVYTKSVIESLAGNTTKLSPDDLEKVDGAFAGALIRATK
ncbi:MAG TPA: arsenite methyltransferase [Syntrophomonadaceae bacterium]|nr:arsenite methyltransferase [Syntrophomonadaceae bacterium]